MSKCTDGPAEDCPACQRALKQFEQPSSNQKASRLARDYVAGLGQSIRASEIGAIYAFAAWFDNERAATETSAPTLEHRCKQCGSSDVMPWPLASSETSARRIPIEECRVCGEPGCPDHM